MTQHTIAMWSGPRNISTAMMRSWENRPDTHVSDEPFYAHYLATTGKVHPMQDEVLASQSQEWRVVRDLLTGAPPNGQAVWYQKQMAHHVTDEMNTDWVLSLSNAFLIRDPREMVMSYMNKMDSVTPADLGIDVQVRLFDKIRRHTGKAPPVILGRDVLKDPRGALTKLCSDLGVLFDEAMLSWPKGPRDTDGAWAPHWYDSVWSSTGFGPDKEPAIDLSGEHAGVAAACMPAFNYLMKFKTS